MRSEQGKAVLEFALMGPFLFILIFGSIDSFQMLRKVETLSTVTRETGNAAFRNCILIEERNLVNDCLAQTAGIILPYVNGNDVSAGVLPTTHIILRLFRKNSTSLEADDGSFGTIDVVGNSKYSRAEVDNLHSFTDNKEVIVTIEATHQMSGFLPVFKKNLYETAVY